MSAETITHARAAQHHYSAAARLGNVAARLASAEPPWEPMAEDAVAAARRAMRCLRAAFKDQLAATEIEEEEATWRDERSRAEELRGVAEDLRERLEFTSQCKEERES